MFWDQGKKHYQEEVLFYELLSQAGGDGHGGGYNDSQGTSGQSISPINVDASG
jgi:hypothetical protein